MPAEKLRRRVDGEIGADVERVLERRPEEGVVDGDQRLARVRASDVDGVRDVGHAQRGIGRRLDEDELEIAQRGGGAGQCIGIPGRNADHGESQRLEHLMDQVLRAAVQRLRVENRGPARHERETAGRDRRHARVEHRRALCPALERNDVIFEDLGVRVGQARIDQVDVLVLGRR